jgi:hypothetical protein
MLHKAERRTATTKVVRETEAEAIAFVVGKAVGLEAGNRIRRLHPALPRQRFVAGGIAGSHPADLRRHPCRIGAVRSRRDDARCRTGEGGVMQTILRILKKAGGWHPGLYLKIDNPPYMELVIEAMDESGPMGLPAISVAHYGEQNGDLMRDPEMCFELGMAGGDLAPDPFYFRNDYVASSSGAATSCAATMSHCPSLHEQHQRFAEDVGQQPALAGLRRSLHGQVHSRLVRSLGADTASVSPLRVLSLQPLERSTPSWKPQIVNATEYRNLPLALLSESKTNPRRTFEDEP